MSRLAVINSFVNIPLTDIHTLFSHNHVKYEEDSNIYEMAYNLILSESLDFLPDSILDWMYAYNLSSEQILISSIKSSDILSSKSLVFDRERIIRICGFLGVLNNDISVFDLIPSDAVMKILEYLDLEDIFLVNMISKQFNNLYNNISEVIRGKLNTKLQIDKYDWKQLKRISKITVPNNIIAGSYRSYMITSRNEVYTMGSDVNIFVNLTNVPTLIPYLNNIVEISAKFMHLLLLDSNGQVYIHGHNSHGQIAENDDKTYHETPILISGLNNIIQISAGMTHSLMLDANGKVYSFGSNVYEALGLPRSVKSVYTATIIPDLDDIIAIAAGRWFSLALRSDGRVFGFGLSDKLQLGINKCYITPMLIPDLNDIIQITAGFEHSLALNKQGQIYSFGSNERGQLGLPIKYISPFDIEIHMPVLIPELNNIISIVAGYYHSLALRSDGKVYAFGHNSKYQLGLPNISNTGTPIIIPNIPNIKQISAGFEHSLLLSEDGTIYSFGANERGELGLGLFSEKEILHVPIPNFHI